VEEGEILLNKKIDSETISRLASNKDIAEWVEQGVHLHKKHSSPVCEYCTQSIPFIRTKQLGRSFNEVDKKLKDDLDILVGKLKFIYPAVQALQAPDRARFYNELQNSFDIKKLDFDLSKQKILSNIAEFAEELKSKKSKTTEVLALKSSISLEDFLAKMDLINKVIETHNKTTSDFEGVKKDAVQKLKFHYLSTIFDDIKKFDANILKITEDIRSLEEEIKDIKKRITDNMAQVSSEHKACEIINKKLATFLGHQEFTFVPYVKKEAIENGEEKEIITGYHIMRGNTPAKYLSEGEKTAIAFIYFVVHLGDQNFNVNDGIIVIDDPISSLDSNSLYQAFSFLKNSVKDGMQVFIFTHSFDFLKLIMNWRKNSGGAGYYMLKNNFPSNIRCAYLDKMDKELCEYESEYHYLFKLLKGLRDEQDDSIAKAYPIPNIARKVWDTFLMFSIPNGKSPYKKMDELKAAGRDEQKLDAIYKFTNDQSHITGSGFDPALVPETKKVVKELFEMMEEISPDHFKIINQATN
jgi:wobble nucleotide-excising tRNase